MKLFSFENLKIWQKSRQLSIAIYKVNRSSPDDERFGLVSQMRRSAISISSNIAKGRGWYSGRDNARFTQISIKTINV